MESWGFPSASQKEDDMKRSLVIGTVLGAGVVLAAMQSFSLAFSQPEGKKPAAPDAMQETWMKLAEKNEHHAGFKILEGTWSAVVKHWDDPSQPAHEAKGTMVNTLLHDGRYVHHDFSGEMFGQPFNGSGLFAYDNATQKYQGTWIDSMSTGIAFSTGDYDAAAKTYTLTSDCTLPGTGVAKQREVIVIADNDHHTMTMYLTMAGQPEIKMMEIAYTRSGPVETMKHKGDEAVKTIKGKLTPGGK